MLFAERVSQSDAATVASNFLNGAVKTSSSTKKSKAATPARMTLKTAASSTASESQFYVYENPDGGWVMVSADDVANPVLAYSKTGSFNFEKMPTNVKAWLKSYENDIKTASEAGLQADEETAAKWDNLKKGLHKVGTPVVSNLIKTKWDQDGVYNSKCPYDETAQENTATGCVATAMAQIMNYWQWPINGVGSHTYEPEVCLDDYCNQTKKVYPQQSVNFAQTTYDWANMLDYYYDCKVANGSVSCTEVNYTTAQGDAISTLMWHCGVAVDMMYDISDNGGSAAYTLGTSEPSAELALQTYFNYKPTLQGVEKSNYGDTQWKNLLKAELDANRPMIYAGGAHCFICDGYDDSDYFRFNWGWSGIDDGYYLLTALTPTTMYGTGGSDYNFTEGQEAIIGIVPNRSDLYILGEVEANDYIWDPSKGAKMDFANNVYTLTTRIKGTGAYGYLSFTTRLASNSSDWNAIASYRWAANTNEKLVTSGQTYDLSQTNVDNAFKFPNGIWTITVDLENKTMTAVQPTTYTVSWNDKGTVAQEEFAENAKLVLPIAPADCSGTNGKNFVGWTESSSLDGSKPADLFIEAGDKTVTANVTYYAVFATAGEGSSSAGWELVTDASTLKEGDVLVIASNAKGKTAGAISNSIMAEVASTFEDTNLSEIGDGTVELTLGGSEGAWTLTSTEGLLGATAVKKVAWGSGTTTWSISISDDNATIQNGTGTYGRFLHNVESTRFTTYTSNTSNSMLLPQLYRKVGSYSNYSLDCTGSSTPTCTLESIGVDHTNATHEFNVGDAFSSAGIVVTAFYEGDGCNLNSKDVTASVTVTTPDMTTAGNKDVTVSYTEGGVTKTYSYGITVNAVISATHTVTYFTCGEQFTSQTYNDGQSLVFPTNPPAQNGKAFVGWITETSYTGNNAPTFVTAGTPVNADASYYAVYK